MLRLDDKRSAWNSAVSTLEGLALREGFKRMSRIGKKPIPLPQGVKFEVKGNTVVVNGPKGQVQTHLPAGVQLKQVDGTIQLTRQDDDHAAVHGLARALVNNAVEGVTKGWSRDLEIVGIGYRAELKGKNTVVFTLGYS